MAHEESIVPLTVVKTLYDKSYDKRKSASDEITKLVKNADREQQTKQIQRLIEKLSEETTSQNPNIRKGALMGLTAIANGIDNKNFPTYLDKLLEPIFNSLHDSSPNIKYYAGEQLWTICILARLSVLPHFQRIFSVIVNLSMDVDEPVRTQSSRINCALQDIVTESPCLDLLSFIPCLVEKLNSLNAPTQSIVLRWLNILLCLPGLNMVPFIPELTEGVFNIMCSSSDENNENSSRAGNILHEFTSLIEKNANAGNSFKYVDMINVVVFYADKDNYNVQNIAFVVIVQFIEIAKKAMLPYSPGILRVVMRCKLQDTQDPYNKVSKQLAEEASAKLMALINDEDDVVYIKEVEDSAIENSSEPSQQLVSADKLEDKMYLNEVVPVFEAELKNTSVACKTTALRWLYHLNDKVPNQMENFTEREFHCLLKVIGDPADEIVLLALQVLAQIASSNFRSTASGDNGSKRSSTSLVPGSYFERSHHYLLVLFGSDLDKDKTKMSFIIRQLCVILPAEDNYLMMAKLLLHEEKLDFAKGMVQTLSNILFTSKELFDLRKKLIHSTSKESSELFVKLYYTWCHSSVATITLCLLTGNYSLALEIIKIYGALEVTADSLIELDKLIQMLESPIFAFLRLELLNPKENAALVDALFCILMLMPQTNSFNLLHKRLQCIPTCYLEKSKSKNIPINSAYDFDKLLEHYNATHQKHLEYKERQVISRLRSSLSTSS